MTLKKKMRKRSETIWKLFETVWNSPKMVRKRYRNTMRTNNHGDFLIGVWVYWKNIWYQMDFWYQKTLISKMFLIANVLLVVLNSNNLMQIWHIWIYLIRKAFWYQSSLLCLSGSWGERTLTGELPREIRNSWLSWRLLVRSHRSVWLVQSLSNFKFQLARAWACLVCGTQVCPGWNCLELSSPSLANWNWTFDSRKKEANNGPKTVPNWSETVHHRYHIDFSSISSIRCEVRYVIYQRGVLDHPGCIIASLYGYHFLPVITGFVHMWLGQARRHICVLAKTCTPTCDAFCKLLVAQSSTQARFQPTS